MTLAYQRKPSAGGAKMPQAVEAVEEISRSRPLETVSCTRAGDSNCRGRFFHYMPRRIFRWASSP